MYKSEPNYAFNGYRVCTERDTIIRDIILFDSTIQVKEIYYFKQNEKLLTLYSSEMDILTQIFSQTHSKVAPYPENFPYVKQPTKTVSKSLIIKKNSTCHIPKFSPNIKNEIRIKKIRSYRVLFTSKCTSRKNIIKKNSQTMQ